MELRHALLVGLMCGLVGVLVDLDHIVAYYAGYPAGSGRVFHEHILIASGIMLCGLIAYLAGLLGKAILK